VFDVPVAVGRYFIFQVFAVFIFNFLLGTVTSDLLSVVNKFREIADEPTKRVPELLGVGAAQTSSFYMSYILINVSGKPQAVFPSPSLCHSTNTSSSDSSVLCMSAFHLTGSGEACRVAQPPNIRKLTCCCISPFCAAGVCNWWWPAAHRWPRPLLYLHAHTLCYAAVFLFCVCGLQACAIGGGLLRIVGLVLYFIFMKHTC
jgi:hypothetical protein